MEESINLQLVLVGVLGVWRMTSLLCYEAGPFNVITRLRKLLYRCGFGSLIDCFHCTGLWLAALVALYLYHLKPITLLMTLAISGGASILERWLLITRTDHQ